MLHLMLEMAFIQDTGSVTLLAKVDNYQSSRSVLIPWFLRFKEKFFSAVKLSRE